MGQVNDKMQRILMECFDARLRELESLKTISDNIDTIDADIKSIEAIKELQKDKGLLKH
jgi:hypothetical protein